MDESYQHVGDLAETISLLLASKYKNEILPDEKNTLSLSSLMQFLQNLKELPIEEQKHHIIALWKSFSTHECFVFLKLITGGFRVGVSAATVAQALSHAFCIPSNEIQHLLSGNWSPLTTTWKELMNAGNHQLSKPYPLFLCYALDTLPELFSPEEWIAEWKWDGIRGQIIKRSGELFIWSRGDELLTDHFPELHSLTVALPDGTVLDGEIICLKELHSNPIPLPFSSIQKRINKKNPGKRLLQESPIGFIAYDLLEWQNEDIRQQPLFERKTLLHKVIQSLADQNIIISPEIQFHTGNELASYRGQARERGCEGIMLKRKASPYLSGRKKGDWWKWKTDPMTIDCVLMYAQTGHGRRSGLYTDYTFAVKNGEKLITFTKAYSGLTDAEIKEVDAFVKKNALEKFGPVRTVKPELVFELAFEGIQESKRHKCGIALRFPRIHRWRRDKTGRRCRLRAAAHRQIHPQATRHKSRH